MAYKPTSNVWGGHLAPINWCRRIFLSAGAWLTQDRLLLCSGMLSRGFGRSSAKGSRANAGAARQPLSISATNSLLLT